MKKKNKFQIDIDHQQKKKRKETHILKKYKKLGGCNLTILFAVVVFVEDQAREDIQY